jgi:CO/xanthine dehydrogenase FAD-binding subunit
MPVSVKTCATPAEVAAALASDRGARFIAGGTLVMRSLNEGDIGISTLVRLADRALSQIRLSGPQVTLGAEVTLAAILRERELGYLHGVVQSIGGPAVRTTGTVGGNLFAPPPFGDLAVALLALDATVSVQIGYSVHEMSLDEFLSGRDRNTGQLVLRVSFERPAGALRWRKATRVKPKGASIVAIAAHLPNLAGRVASARIAYGAMAPTAIRARAAERTLEGRMLDEAGVAGAVAAAAEGTSPATDAIASAWYRREVVGVHLRRLLLGRDI